MLVRIRISNFLLIDQINLRLHEGLTAVTGETGAGKSIILGGLNLVLGKRADLKQIKDQDKKCVIEAVFEDRSKRVEQFLLANDFDIEDQIIMRREISNSGRSRSFINDTPAQLQQLEELGSMLIDLHSQFANLEIGSRAFKFKVVDTFSNSLDLFLEYQSKYQDWRRGEKQLEQLREALTKATQDQDYYEYQLKEFEELSIQPGEYESKKEELDRLSHSEEIKSTLTQSSEVLRGDSIDLLRHLRMIKDEMSGIANYSDGLDELNQRLNSVFIELEDIANEIDIVSGASELDEEQLTKLKERVDQINHFLHKYRVSSSEDLLHKQSELEGLLQDNSQLELKIKELEARQGSLESELRNIATNLHLSRVAKLNALESTLTESLVELGMPNARLNFHLDEKSELDPYGCTELELLFSANKGLTPGQVEKSASGGELSRIMLAVKSMLSDRSSLPTIIFDEIDTGISGEIASKMGEIMKRISANTQVIAITHLPQVAAKGKHHWLVKKDHQGSKTVTEVLNLAKEDRVIELAKMLSGESLSEAARENARNLLNN